MAVIKSKQLISYSFESFKRDKKRFNLKSVYKKYTIDPDNTFTMLS